MSVLAASLFVLEFAAIRLIRAHFLEEYGPQAWLLPIGIGLIFCFILYRLIRLWREVRERIGDLREDGDADPMTTDEGP